MDSNKLKDWMEIIGIFALVASLVFVGLQMRQTQKISLSQAYQSRTSAAAEWNSTFASNAAALAAMRKGAEGHIDDITPAEHDALYRQLVGVVYLYDNAHYQYHEGFVSESFWQSTRASLKNIMSNSVAKAVFEQRMDYGMRPEFRDVVAEVLAELEAEHDE